MKVKTNTLSGLPLRLAVAMCLKLDNYADYALSPKKDYVKVKMANTAHWEEFTPDTSWTQGGPIVDHQCISVEVHFDRNEITAWTPAPEIKSGTAKASAETALLASMRCYVISKFDQEIEIEDEILAKQAEIDEAQKQMKAQESADDHAFVQHMLQTLTA